MAERTLAENVAQVKADFKSVKDAIDRQVGYDLDNVPTSEYGNKVNDACVEMYKFGKEDGILEGYENGKIDGINDGYTSGKADGIYEGIEQVISNSRYIEKQASGKFFRLDDVSEVAHKVVVKADTPTEVKVYGKNLFDLSVNTRFTKQDDGSYINNNIVPATKFPLALPYGTYTYSYDLSCPSGKNGRITFILKDGTLVETYIASNGSFKHINQTFTGEVVNWQFTFSNLPEAETVVIKNLQLECGSYATPYEEYKGQTITATPTGTKVPSICPTMTFLADNEITVDYYASYGMQTEYDKFWDAFQYNKGLKMSYSMAFSTQRWRDDNFKPKYDIIASDMSQCFYTSNITDLVKILAEQGVILDTSGVSSMSYAFGYSTIYRIPTINLSKATNTAYMCANYGSTSTGYARNQLRSIEKIISSETTVFANNAFSYCDKLEHCIFEGIIASDINLQWSTKLSVESLVSLLTCIKNYDSSGEQWTKTIILSSESWALLEAQGAVATSPVTGESITWLEYVEHCCWNAQ